MSIFDFLNVGTTLDNGINMKKRVGPSSEVTKYIRIAASFRPYINGGPRGDYLPKGGSLKDASMVQQFKIAFRYGPIFDAQFRRPQN